MAPSVPLRACFRKWSGLDCVESYLIVSSAVLKVLISAHRGDWLRVKCALMNTNLRCGLGLSGICWASESGGQVIRLLQVYQRTLGFLAWCVRRWSDVTLPARETWQITAGAMWLHVWSAARTILWIVHITRSCLSLTTNQRPFSVLQEQASSGVHYSILLPCRSVLPSVFACPPRLCHAVISV